jgi:hypothetical protein
MSYLTNSVTFTSYLTNSVTFTSYLTESQASTGSQSNDGHRPDGLSLISRGSRGLEGLLVKSRRSRRASIMNHEDPGASTGSPSML